MVPTGLACEGTGDTIMPRHTPAAPNFRRIILAVRYVENDRKLYRMSCGPEQAGLPFRSSNALD
jgi:hypothetical protein